MFTNASSIVAEYIASLSEEDADRYCKYDIPFFIVSGKSRSQTFFFG